MDADLYQVTYIVTFFSHFGAVRYKQLCAEAGVACRMMPVPRDLSSSCGTCVRCEGGYLPPGGACAEEIEQIAREKLGMEKVADGQTSYISLTQDDEGTVVQAEKTPNLLDRIWQVLQSLFS